MPRYKRHELEVTADRLGGHYEKFNEVIRNEYGGSALDEISHVIFMLTEIAEGNVDR